mgnify:CR=1 FL=1
MTDFAKLQQELLTFLKDVEGQFVEHAKTYAGAILLNLEEGARYGKTPEKATYTQLLYVFSNLSDVPRETLERLNTLLLGYGFDMSEIIEEILENQEVGEREMN